MAKVLIHSIVFSPDSLSTSHLLTDLAHELSKHGHEMTVLTTTPHYNVLPEALERQPLKPVGRRKWLFESQVGKIKVYHVKISAKGKNILARMTRGLRFHFYSLIWGLRGIPAQDVVLVDSLHLTIGLVGWILALRWKGASVYVLQDVFPDGLIRDGKIRSKPLIWFLRRLERFVYNRSKAVVVIAKSFERTVRPRIKDPSKVIRIPNFVDTDLYRPLPRDNEFTREYGLGKKFVVSYAGNIGNAQDLTPMLTAAEKLRDFPIVFLVVGDGIDRKRYEEEAARRDLTNIMFLGYKPREMMPLIYASSDISTVLLDAHVSGDGFPSKIYAIMAHARSVIAVCDEISDLALVINESGCGRLASISKPESFAEEVLKAYNEPEVIRSEGEKGRKYVLAGHSKTVIGQKYHELVTAIVEGAF